MLKPINIKSAFNINFNDKIKKAYLKNRDNIKKTPLHEINESIAFESSNIAKLNKQCLQGNSRFFCLFV